jgi:hypothetical protein
VTLIASRSCSKIAALKHSTFCLSRFRAGPLLRSNEGFSIPGDEFLDRHRLAATDFGDITVGTGENAVTVIDRNLLQMLDDKRLSRIGAECTGITVKRCRGLVQKAPSSTRIFLGSDAEKILRAAIPFGSFGVAFRNVTHYKHRVPFEVGPFRITPFLNNHSTFDAYSFLVEADGRSLFYSADFRGTVEKRPCSINF